MHDEEPAIWFPERMMLYQYERASTQPNSATQVAANSTGIANASGRPIDSPSFRPAAANAATVRAYSGTARRMCSKTWTQYRQCRTWTRSHRRLNARAAAVSGTNTPTDGSLW